MENRLLVFVSSVIAGMAAERQAAEAAIRAIPLSRPWVFEHTPASTLPLTESYLSQVRTCDIFVLLLRDAVSEPVKAEVATALAEKRPILVFLWQDAPGDVTAYAQSIGVRYATFADAADLGRQVAEAVSDELITGYRRHRLSGSDLAGTRDFQDSLGEGKIVVRSQGGAVVFGPVTVGAGGKFVGRDEINITAEAPPKELLAAYLAHLADRCGELPLGIVDKEFVRTSGGQPLTLPDIYVDLDVVAAGHVPAMADKGTAQMLGDALTADVTTWQRRRARRQVTCWVSSAIRASTPGCSTCRAAAAGRPKRSRGLWRCRPSRLPWAAARGIRTPGMTNTATRRS